MKMDDLEVPLFLETSIWKLGHLYHGFYSTQMDSSRSAFLDQQFDKRDIQLRRAWHFTDHQVATTWNFVSWQCSKIQQLIGGFYTSE